MIETRWFISYKTQQQVTSTLTGDLIVVGDLVVTDVTPARWVMYHKLRKNEECIILYAEEISPALAAELTHSAGVNTEYFKEVG